MPKLKFYNTLTRKKEVFEPLHDDYVRMYDCGPTVYFYAHIGNMWRNIMSDLIRRVLEYNGYEVKQVMNITDVGHLTDEDLAADTGEDKIEKAARKEKKTPQEIASFYTEAFLRDLDRLNIQRPHIMPKATEHIEEMIELIKKLEEKGYTYRAGKYLVYDISKFADYGKLSGKDLEELKSGARLEPVPGKRNPFDFALWIEDPEHLQKWDSPWGVGYPGWHIECSTMSMTHLGEQLDIHTGGEDNIFPHHENEIAQSEAATGKEFVRYWLHAGFLQVEGGKMSKSKGNMYLIQDIIDRGFDPLAFRYLCLTAHYRHPLNFTWEALGGAQSALTRLRRAVRHSGLDPESDEQNSRQILKRVQDDAKRVQNDAKAAQGAAATGEKNVAAPHQNTNVAARPWGAQEERRLKSATTDNTVASFSSRFLSAVNDDLNMPRALAVVWDAVKTAEKNPDLRFAVCELLLDFDKVLGLGLADVEPVEIPGEVQELVEKREKLRAERKWKEADELREKIQEQGFEIEDTEKGPKLCPA